MSDEKQASSTGAIAGFFRRNRGWFVLIVLALAAEGVTRFRQYRRFGDMGTYKPRHLVDFYRFYRVNPAFRNPQIRVNAAGFRDDIELPKHKPKNELRVFIVGGSTVWGENGIPFDGVGRISNEHTIAAHLGTALAKQAALRGDSVHVRVINAGVVGYRLFQDLAFFNNYIADLEPDLVIALDGHNDLDGLQLGVPFYSHRNDGSFDHELNSPSAIDLIKQTGTYLGTHSLFVRKATVKFTEKMSGMAVSSQMWKQRFLTPPPDTTIGAFLADYESTVRRFNASAEIAGVPILFSVQNEIAGERWKPLTPLETQLKKEYEYYTWLHTTMHDRLVQRMDSLRKTRGLWFEDVTNVFATEKEQAYIDYTHVSSRGAEVLANRFATVVAPTLFCEPGGRPSARCDAKRGHAMLADRSPGARRPAGGSGQPARVAVTLSSRP